jgi:formate--tetrahydrofolate ligase
MPSPRPIAALARDLGLDPTDRAFHPFGHDFAKIDTAAAGPGEHGGRLVVVSAITPTPLGEGKTVTSISLSMGLNTIGERSIVCLRQPSLGPVFGSKGGGAGGGRAQVVPADRINLGMTGDGHAIGAAHNLLAAMLDAHLRHGNELRLDPVRVTWPRVSPVNDGSLRKLVVGLGGPLNGVPRESFFEINEASEVMAIVALARDRGDLRRRLGNIVVGQNHAGEPVRAEQLGAAGAMSVLLRDALYPTLAQTSEGTPALIHAGPFANIAHGNNSVIATRFALTRAPGSSPSAASAPTSASRSSCTSRPAATASSRPASSSSRPSAPSRSTPASPRSPSASPSTRSSRSPTSRPSSAAPPTSATTCASPPASA